MLAWTRGDFPLLDFIIMLDWGLVVVVQGKGRLGRRTARAVLAAFVAALVLKFFVFDFMLVEGESMEPGLVSGQMVMVNRLAYGVRSPFPVKSGRRYLVRWKAPSENDVVVFWTPLGELAVKRIYSLLPGERFIALGDNSLQSYDSRAYGPVLFDNIIGKVLKSDE
ncbi:MAG: signal peptidase I [Spirochaetaceae bacterium]|nr:signal peptidase I [Spirochaetaceae bacterium]